MQTGGHINEEQRGIQPNFILRGQRLNENNKALTCDTAFYIIKVKFADHYIPPPYLNIE